MLFKASFSQTKLQLVDGKYPRQGPWQATGLQLLSFDEVRAPARGNASLHCLRPKGYVMLGYTMFSPPIECVQKLFKQLPNPTAVDDGLAISSEDEDLDLIAEPGRSTTSRLIALVFLWQNISTVCFWNLGRQRGMRTHQRPISDNNFARSF